MIHSITCPECGEYFRASSIFVDRPSLTHCPFCGSRLEREEGKRLVVTPPLPRRSEDSPHAPCTHRAA